MANDKTRIRSGIVVDADRKNDEIGILMMEREERWHLFNARHAPAGPEVEQDDTSAVAGKVNGGSAVGDCEIGSRFAGLRGMRTAIARRQKG